MAALEEGVLDTSTVIRLGEVNPKTLPPTPRITAITLAELVVGPLIAKSGRERAIRQAHVLEAEASFEPLPFDEGAARAFGLVAESLRRSGRKPSARSYDALIASIAVSRGLPVFTLNPRDFAGIDQLVLVPLTPDS